MYDFDLFVIGAGSGGVRAARMASKYGARVAIAEDRYMGGTCVNVGCIPKKLYTFASHYSFDFEDSQGFGWSAKTPVFDWTRLRDNKKREISRLNGIYESILDNAEVKLIESTATIVDAHTIKTGGKTFTSRYILIASGSWPFVPDFPGNEFVVTSNDIFDLEEFPERILIIGGGYIAVEFAGIFSGLGAKTALSYRREIPLRGFDEEIRHHFHQEMGKHVDLYMNTNVKEVSRNSDGSLLVSFIEGKTLNVDVILIATGRKPNTSGLGLENVNMEIDKNGAIIVDDYFQTTEGSIYALGDVIGRVALTPVALAEGMALARTLFTDEAATMTYRNIPTCVFSHPNIGTVGLTEEQARAEYPNLSLFRSEFRHLRHTISGRDEKTFMKIIVNKDNDKVLGMHMIGADAGEIIQGFGVAMNCGLTKSILDSTIGIHPTSAEEFVTLRKSS